MELSFIINYKRLENAESTDQTMILGRQIIYLNESRGRSG